VEVSARVFVRFLHPLDVRDDIQRLDHVHIHFGRVADKTQYQVRLAQAFMYVQILVFSQVEGAEAVPG
jgi:hypothetical protein